MKLIINIPDRMYNAIKEYPWCYNEEVFRWIKQGIPLSEELEQIKAKIEEHNRKYLSDDNAGLERAIWDFIEPRISELKGDTEKKYEAKAITRGNCMICGKELTDGLFFCKECEDKEAEPKGMTLKENIKAILECNFSIAKDEVIEAATKRIMEQIESQKDELLKGKQNEQM